MGDVAAVVDDVGVAEVLVARPHAQRARLLLNDVAECLGDGRRGLGQQAADRFDGGRQTAVHGFNTPASTVPPTLNASASSGNARYFA